MCALRTVARYATLKRLYQVPANGGRTMITCHNREHLPIHPIRLHSVTSFEVVLTAISMPLVLPTGGPTARMSTGGFDDTTTDWETILNKLYNVLNITVPYAGLTILAPGILFSDGHNSPSSETGMTWTMGSAAMGIVYFGQSACVCLLKSIPGRSRVPSIAPLSATSSSPAMQTHRHQHRSSAADCQMNGTTSLSETSTEARS